LQRNFFISTGNCVVLNVNNGTLLEQNTFNSCGTYSVYAPSAANMHLISNYFEGTVTGTLGSIFLGGNGVNIIANTFEDNCACVATTWRSIIITTGNSTIIDGNYWVGGVNPPQYYVKLGVGTANQTNVSFSNNVVGAGVALSGFFIDNEDQGGQKLWTGGMNCDPSQIWGGAQASSGQLSAACGSPAYHAPIAGHTPFDILANGVISRPADIASDTPPTPTGTCGANISNTHGGMSRGEFLTAAGPCSGGTLILTFAITAPNGWYCNLKDTTTLSDTLLQSAFSTTTATMISTWVANDLLLYECGMF
jgi:hypothetical protein